MTEYKVYYAGYELTEYMTATVGLDRGILPESEQRLLKIGNDDGNRLLGSSYGVRKIHMPFALNSELLEKRRELARILNTKEEQPLVFSDEPDKVWFAIPQGDIGVDEQQFLGKGTIDWVIPDGVAHAIDPKFFGNIPEGSSGENLILDPEFVKKNKYWKPWAQLLNEKHERSSILRGNFTDPTTADNSPAKVDHWFQRNEVTTRNTPEIKKGDAVSLAIDIRIVVPTSGDSNGSKTSALILEEWDRIGGTILERHTIRPTDLRVGEWQQLSLVNEKIRNGRTTAINLAVGVYGDATIDISKPRLNVGSELLPYTVSDVELDGTVDIVNEGTYKAYPIIRARMNGENGLVAFVKNNGGILQFGNPEELDIVQGVRSDKVIDYSFKGSQPELNINDGGASMNNVIDFKKKVSGSAKENSSIIYSNSGKSLLNPDQLNYETSTIGYNNVSSLDGKIYTTRVTTKDEIRQVGIAYNIVEDIQRRYPWVFSNNDAVTLEQRVSIARQFIKQLTYSVDGYGSGSLGSKFVLDIYSTKSGWSSNLRSHTNDNVTNLSVNIGGENRIDDSGLVYAIVYSFPSDGKIPSIVNLDYVNLSYSLSSENLYSGVSTYPNYLKDPKRPNLVKGHIDWLKDSEAATPYFANGNVKVWGGPRMWGDVPRNSQNNNTGDFNYKNRFNFNTNVPKQGRIEFVLQNDKEVAFAMVIRDSSATKDELIVECWFGEKNYKSMNLDRNVFRFPLWEAQISRSGSKIEFKISNIFEGDYTKSVDKSSKIERSAISFREFTVKPGEQLGNVTKKPFSEKFATYEQKFVIDMVNAADVPITGLTTWFQRFGNTNHVLMSWNDCKFTWVNTPTYRNIPNLFNDGDLVEINVKNREIAVNGVINNQLHALGNNWEKFVSEPGEETIQPIASSWANMYEVEVEIQEAYL